MNKAIDMGFDKGLVSRKLELWLNGQVTIILGFDKLCLKQIVLGLVGFRFILDNTTNHYMAQQEFLLARLGW